MMLAIAPEIVPTNIEAEQALIGAVLCNNDCLDGVADIVSREHFYEPVHTSLWAKISEMIGAGQVASPVTLIAALGQDAKLPVANGLNVSAYIARLAAEAVSTIQAPDYARVVREAWARRRIADLGRTLISEAAGGFTGLSVEDLLDEADSELGAIRFGQDQAGILSLGDLARSAVQHTADAYRLEGRVGFDTGIAPLDEILGVMMPGDMGTLLAASGAGKTALATQILKHNAEPGLDANRGKPAFLVSGEMKGVDIARRVLASSTGIATRRQKTGEVVQAEYEALDVAAQHLSPIPVYIDGSGPQTMARIEKKIRSMRKRYGIGIAAIDHVKLIKPENRRWSKIDTIADAAERAKALAKDLDIVLIVLAQATRESQKSERTWRLSDQAIFGGDELKQFSDFLLSLSIPSKWLADREPDRDHGKEHDKWIQDSDRWAGKAEIGTLKCRDGEDHRWRTLSWSGETMTFGE